MVGNSFLNLIPGQAAWQNSVASAQSGNYGQAAAHFGIMAAEQVLTVASLGTSAGVGAVSRAGSTAARGVGTAADDAAFWSGRAGANRSAAEASGLTTLERTPAGRALDAQDLFSKLPYDEAIVPWENLSRQFAREASGTVNAWTGGASPTSVWSRIEKPTLMLNPNVNKIIINDATQPWKTKIIYK
jgi:hypothetical protein